MKTLHKKFLTETDMKVSYSLFCYFKPFYILKATEKDRETCLCKTHENLCFKLNKCFQEQIIKSNNIETFLKDVTCNIENKDCMYRDCSNCKDRCITLSDDVDSGKQTWWFVWKNRREEREKQKNGQGTTTVNITVKEKEYGSRQILTEELNKDISKASRHIFNIQHQYKTIRYLRQRLTHEEIMMQIDFSENYNCKYASEIQSMHFGCSQRQISLHTGVAYTKNTLYSFCTVSDCLKHGPAAIWAHLHPILEELRSKTQATKIHFISDGPTTQYRNKHNFYLFSTKLFRYGFTEATWNLLEAGHGKGAADGIGGAIKRTADNYVNKGGDIKDASDLVDALTSAGSSIIIHKVVEDEVTAIEATLPTTLKPLLKTMQIHQVLVSSPGEVRHRVLSCFCQKPTFCNCYDPVVTTFPIESVPSDTLPTDVVTGSCTAETEREPGDLVKGTERDVPVRINRALDPATSAVGDVTDANASSPLVNHKDIPNLVKVDVVDNSIVNKYCVVKYDDQAYPGIIHDVDDDEEVEVQVMHRIGRNRFFWPLMQDILWYPKENIITMLADPPQLVTKRHHEITPKIWALIEKELN
ncbi:uncharacterized protein [Argopecten irradians]|uniref:uncharacterized protein n=1 Tax=Argopecten irradians TaxID=31199 RepID=UPI00371C213D